MKTEASKLRYRLKKAKIAQLKAISGIFQFETKVRRLSDRIRYLEAKIKEVNNG